MSAVLFWDPVCLDPYDSATIRSRASGGTESSLVRVAEALDARVVQHNRTEAHGRYLPPGVFPGIDCVVVNRDPAALPELRQRYPDARLLLWLHDQIRPGSTRGRRLAAMVPQLRALSVEIVCVSNWQREAVLATLRRVPGGESIRAHAIYNPIDSALAPDDGAFDPDKLVFFSSPNKGLKFALEAFQAMRRRIPGLRLVIGNPGYKPDLRHRIEGVTALGPQPQVRIHDEVRGALCTFAPNFVIPETFGLVFAESHALGTPVLTYDCGAASEIVGDRAQLLPVRTAHRAYEAVLGKWPSTLRRGPAWIADRLGLFDACTERIRAWRDGARPRVEADPRFALAAVAGQWRNLLSG
jgi:glycosyltransferase involved in cell wall biosynthesis